MSSVGQDSTPARSPLHMLLIYKSATLLFELMVMNSSVSIYSFVPSPSELETGRAQTNLLRPAWAWRCHIVGPSAQGGNLTALDPLRSVEGRLFSQAWQQAMGQDAEKDSRRHGTRSPRKPKRSAQFRQGGLGEVRRHLAADRFWTNLH